MKLRRKTPSEEITGFLDHGTDVTGELRFSGTLRIDGGFHGSITTGDILIVGEHAVLHADVKVGEIEVHGRIFGSIEAQRRVRIFPTGRVRGDIQSPMFILDAGGTFDGRSRMSAETEDAAAVEGRQADKERTR